MTGRHQSCIFAHDSVRCSLCDDVWSSSHPSNRERCRPYCRIDWRFNYIRAPAHPTGARVNSSRSFINREVRGFDVLIYNPSEWHPKMVSVVHGLLLWIIRRSHQIHRPACWDTLPAVLRDLYQTFENFGCSRMPSPLGKSVADPLKHVLPRVFMPNSVVIGNTLSALVGSKNSMR